MIEKLRRKIIIYATSSIFALLLLIFATINIVNFSVLANNADEVTALLAQEGGSFLPPGPGPGQEGGDPMGPISPETKMSTRYFTVAIAADGTASLVHMSFTERSVTPEEALSWGASLASSTKGWTRTYYRYRTYQHDASTYVSVIDYSRELSPSYRVLWSSIVGSAVGVLVSFLILLPVSNLFVKPLRDSVAKQRRFISDASHELKTPITIISANNEIIEATEGESESTKAIAKQVGRLTEMVKDLNALARLEENEKPIHASFDLAAIAAEVTDGFAEAFASKEIKLTIEIPDSLTVNADEDGLRRLISIFMDNALKYARTYAEFHLYHHGEKICIETINDADGIEEGSLDRVFERFYRGDLPRASEVEGSGLGLSIAKQIVERHHGRITAKGENGAFVIKAEL